MAHALLSPSSAHRWAHCPGSIVLEQGYEDKGSSFAAEGTAAHELAARCLLTQKDAAVHIGEAIEADGQTFTVDFEMAENVQTYLDYVRALGGVLKIEQALPLQELTGEDGAHGTADAVVMLEDELIIVDLKYGRGVKVEARGNEQLGIYAAAAHGHYGPLADFQRVRLVIVQPRLNHISEHDYTIGELNTFAERIRIRAARARECLAKKPQEITAEELGAGEKSCRFCKAKADCPAAAALVFNAVADAFVDETQPIKPQIEHTKGQTHDNATLANKLAAVDYIEDWCKAIRARAHSELEAGRSVPGYKLVEGRAGARTWADVEEAEALMKKFKLKAEEIYDMKLISPTSAEKLHKAGAIGPRQWAGVQALITRKPGSPTVAPESDKRPALETDPAAGFEDETAAALV